MTQQTYPAPAPLPSGHRRLHWLGALRRERGWSQLRLAAEADVMEGTIRRLEAGGAAQLATVHRLAHALHVPSQVLHAPADLLVRAGTGVDAAAYAQRLARRGGR